MAMTIKSRRMATTLRPRPHFFPRHTPPQPKKNADERKAILEADPRAAEVRAESILCKKCNKWIKLTKGRQYILRHWNEHQSRCDIQPSERVAAAERKLQLVNDSQVKYFTGELVQCATCGITIQLQGVEYELTEWIKHKGLNCGNRPSDNGEDAGSLDQQNTLPFPSTRPPPSSSSTDGTLIATGPSSGPRELSPTHGVKRVREEEEEAEPSVNEQPDRRPSNRQRDAEYAPEEREAPSALGWFMLPFAAFVRGFRESLGLGIRSCDIIAHCLYTVCILDCDTLLYIYIHMCVRVCVCTFSCFLRGLICSPSLTGF
ncbi:Peroxisomal targeting signal receptor [Salix suchowensis]|nr:Peroxisomal targeting signal receptor [Salix suchowensis]